MDEYANTRPALDLFDYFNGKTRGWGMFQDRGGKLKRSFIVDITGTVDESGRLKLEENFVWNDGEVSQRIWYITKTGDQRFEGTASDVVGKAQGRIAGNALNWRYDLNLSVGDNVWRVHFDDWMFLQPDGVLLNRAKMSKFGFRLGEVTIAFRKEPES